MRAAVLALLLAVAGCPSDDAAWSVALDGDDLDRVGLSAWGTAADDVWIAGGGLGNDLGALALHYDGTSWREFTSPTDDTFWWVWGPSPGTAYFVGEGGAIVRIAGGAVELQPTPTDLTLYGIWGAPGAGELWAVGGDPLASEPTPVILRWDGSQWVDATPAVTTGGALFKVWGSSASDIWACGQGGTLLHYDGSDWRAVESGSTAPLFTVAGSAADDVWAVGGPPSTVLHYDGTAWSTVDTGIPASVLNGVATGAGDEVVVVGMGGLKLRYDGAAWSDETDEPPFIDLHAVWVGPEGDAYAVGGNFYAPGQAGVPRIGTVAYYGTRPPPDSL